MSQEQEPEDLEHFITKHKDLLTVIGVFAGLTALFTRLEIKEIGNILSAFSFAVVLLLSWELLTKSPKGFYTNDRLTFFKVMIIFLLVFIMIYLAVVYTAYSVIFGILFMAIYGSAMVAMYARFRAKYKRTGKVVDFIGKTD